MTEITGKWSTDGYIVTSLVDSGNTRYKAYFSRPLEILSEGQRLEKFSLYGDRNNNGIYDSTDPLIAPVAVRSFGNLGGFNGTLRSTTGSNVIYSYIDGIAVGEATVETQGYWETAEGKIGNESEQNTQPDVKTETQGDDSKGSKNGRDIFRLERAEIGRVDKITGFRGKGRDRLSISRADYGIKTGSFAMAKSSRSLTRLLESETEIIYARKTGELVLNANNRDPGFGEGGGTIAILEGKPLLNSGSVVFF